LFPVAHRLVVVVIGIAAGPVSFSFGRNQGKASSMNRAFLIVGFFFLLQLGVCSVLPIGAGADEKPNVADVPEGYEIVESLLRPGKPVDKQQDLDKQLETALGKEAAKKVVRDGPYLAAIKWEPKKVKPGDKLRVYFSSVSPVSHDTVYITVNGKVVWKRKTETELSEEIEIPKPSEAEKGAPLRINVDWSVANYHAGVVNIYLLRPVGKKE
jgi:hypothetical protein